MADRANQSVESAFLALAGDSPLHRTLGVAAGTAGAAGALALTAMSARRGQELLALVVHALPQHVRVATTLLNLVYDGPGSVLGSPALGALTDLSSFTVAGLAFLVSPAIRLRAAIRGGTGSRLTLARRQSRSAAH